MSKVIGDDEKFNQRSRNCKKERKKREKNKQIRRQMYNRKN